MCLALQTRAAEKLFRSDGGTKWIVSRCAPVIAKIWVARSTSARGQRLTAQLTDIDAVLCANLHRVKTWRLSHVRHGRRPTRLRCLRVPSSPGVKKSFGDGLRQMFPVQTKRTLFTVSAAHLRRISKLWLNLSKSTKVSRTIGASRGWRFAFLCIRSRVRASWKRFRYRLEWLALVAAMKLLPLLPLAVCAALARFLGAAAYAIDGRGRRVALSNLECAFGNRFSPKERETIARQSFQSLRERCSSFSGART